MTDTPYIPRSDRYWSEVPRVLRWLGCFAWERGSLRFRWGEVSYNRFGFGLTYSVYHETAHVCVHILWIALYLKAPMLIRQRPGTEDWNARYGASTFEGAVHLNWRLRCKIVHMPWTWGSAVRWSVFDANGKKHPIVHQYDDGPYVDQRHIEKHPYVYVLRSGEIQHRTATIYGSEIEWRLRYTPWLPWPRKVSRSIDVRFDDEVGERTGSWKGGCIGCSYEWRDGESMRGCLQRMQHEREFK